MNLYQEYQAKLRTPEEAVQVVKSGDWVDYTSVLCYPPLLDAALAKRRDQLTDVKVRGNLLFGPIQIIECDPNREHFVYNSWHCSAYERRMCDQGRCSYIPMVFRKQPFYYRNFLTVNVAMMAVPPMDKHGYFNFSCAVGVGRSILEKADIVILEVNEHLPRIYGGFDESIHLSEVDYVVEGPHEPLPQFPVAEPTAEDRAIAELIVPHVRDGATVQLGIGGMPNVVGSLLAQSDLKDLAMHTEVCGDAYYLLHEAGKLTHARCRAHRNKGLAGIVFGSQTLYDWVDQNPGVIGGPIDYINAPSTMAGIDNMVSINAALQIDLTGQVCAESIGPYQHSGTGGATDFAWGAYHSKGGRAILAQTSTTKKGTLSRIVPILDPGAIVSVSRNLTDMVVTEYGVAKLRQRTVGQRVENLIAVAHPDFRAELRKQAAKYMYY